MLPATLCVTRLVSLRLQTTLLALFVSSYLWGGAGQAAGHDPVQEMTDNAQRIVALLDEEQRARCLQPMSGGGREQFNFVPDRFIEPGQKRLGLPLSAMSSQQRLLTHALLTTALSDQGYRRAVSIMALEQVLHELENSNPIRDPDLYYLSIYGQPETGGTWGWRFEGHHLSLNFAIHDGQRVAVTPAFFGTNPAQVRQGPLQGLRVLSQEEDLAREFVMSLSAAQQAKAIVAAEVPADILTTNQSEVSVALFGPAAGIAFEELLPEQQRRLLAVIQQYASSFQAPLVDQVTQRKPLTDGQGLRFVWIGSTEVGAAHYYRIVSPAYAFEYDNTQNDANHIHAVWRDFAGDFGRDLLRSHYREQHAPVRQP